MKQTLLMESVLDETRLAVVEDGRLCELYIERPDSEDIAGSIFLGCVENALPGMNAAFVDIGLSKNGFLSADDIPPQLPNDRALTDAIRRSGRGRLPGKGSQVLVQVTKAQPGQKGPRLSGSISLPGRSMVLMPDVAYVGVSRRIADDGERARLRDIGRRLMQAQGSGMILRTAAAGLGEEALCAEYERLSVLWDDIRRRAAHAAAPSLLFSDGSLVRRAARDMLSGGTDAMWVDDRRLYEEVLAQAEMLAPEWADRIRLHEGDIPLFDLYRVDSQADKALEKYVWLNGGGSLVIEQTEALTVVDVNTGKFTGKRALEQTVLANNCEAAREVMRQLRLRDIGGIVIVDFIDMSDDAHRQQLLDVLREEAARDRNRVSVADITSLGLVEMTRKRVRQPLSRLLTHTCSDCGGNGVVPSHETTARRIAREIWRRRRAGEANPILVEAAAPVCGWLRTLGAPAGGAAYACQRDDLPAGEYRLSPADDAHLPEHAKLLKTRG